MQAELDDYQGDNTQPTAEILNALNSIKDEPKSDILPPVSEYDVLTTQLKEKPHNPEAWRRLIEVAENSGDVEKIQASYDALLRQYPNTVCDLKVLFSPCLISLLVFGTSPIYQPLSAQPEHIWRS